MILICMMACNLLFCQKKEENAKARLLVENQLKLIYTYIKGIDPDSTLKRVAAVRFIEELTKLESESDTWGQIGKLDPTEKDYIIWKGWYDRNKMKIYWESKKQKVIYKP